MGKQIIEAISKAFNRGLSVGKDTVHGFDNSHFIKTALKEEIEDALRKLIASQQAIEVGRANLCEKCGNPLIMGVCETGCGHIVNQPTA